MEQIRIVLVEPIGALNIGSIARVMKNMQLINLVLVNPRCDPVGEEARNMAVHAQDILDNLVITDSLPAALQGCQRAIATTARSRALPTELESPREALPWLIEPNISSALIFGPEDRGLSNQELNYGQRFITIPSNPAYPSLNLAQAVTVCAYELYQATLNKNLDKPSTYVSLQDSQINNFDSSSRQDAPVEAIEDYYNCLESLLLNIVYLYPHTSATRMAKIRRLYNRVNLKAEEVSMLRGMLRQINWAIQENKE
jgi:tRNA/rRNA methyltransferase